MWQRVFGDAMASKPLEFQAAKALTEEISDNISWMARSVRLFYQPQANSLRLIIGAIPACFLFLLPQTHWASLYDPLLLYG